MTERIQRCMLTQILQFFWFQWNWWKSDVVTPSLG